MNIKGVTKTMTALQSIAKKSVKVVGSALPIASVVANGLDVVATYPGDPSKQLRRFIQRYTGVDYVAGGFSGDQLMRGTGSLIISAMAGYAMKQLA